MKIGYSILGLLSLMLLSCGNDTPSIDEDMTPKISLEEKEEAIKLLEKNCYSCHAPDNSTPRLAPPMFAVKNHYYDKGITEKEFVESITDYALNPSKEKSRMPGAVNNFGVMPQSNFDADEVRVIAKYLFYGEIKHPADVVNSTEQSDTLNYAVIGKTAAMEVKQVLGKNLFAAIEKDGAAGAVEFCNTRAIKLTDSVSLAINTKVKRVSNKPRNSNNKANEEEEEIIDGMISLLEQGKELTPKVVEKENKMIGYYPILTNGMCLQCHGKPNENIEQLTLDKLTYLYPNDKAIGYAENELRGVFVVEMDKK